MEYNNNVLKLNEKDISDKDIIQALRYGNDIEANKVLRYLHRNMFLKVAKYIRKTKGTKQDSEDIFQDGLLALYKLIRRGKINLETNIGGYLFAICKNLWLQEVRKKRTLVDFDITERLTAVEGLALFKLMEKEEQEEIHKLLGLIGGNCRKVLVSFYYKRIRLKDIALQMGYASDQVAKNRKSECMKKLRNLLRASSFYMNKIK